MKRRWKGKEKKGEKIDLTKELIQIANWTVIDTDHVTQCHVHSLFEENPARLSLKTTNFIHVIRLHTPKTKILDKSFWAIVKLPRLLQPSGMVISVDNLPSSPAEHNIAIMVFNISCSTFAKTSNNYKYECSMDQELANAAVYTSARRCMCITRWQHFSA